MKNIAILISAGLIIVLGILSWSYREKYLDAREDFMELLLVKPDTVISRDTVRDTIPFPYPKVRTRIIKDTLYLPCFDDSVGLEIEHKHYADSGLYDAYVSGYNPQLDSIKIYTTTFYDTIRIEERIPIPYERKGIWIQSNKHKDKYYGIGSIKR